MSRTFHIQTFTRQSETVLGVRQPNNMGSTNFADAEDRKLRTLLIDNYDSYTYNLYDLIARVNHRTPVVVRADISFRIALAKEVLRGALVT